MMSNNHPTASSVNLPKLSEGQLELLFRRLNLAHTRRIYQEVADRAEKENWTYRDFLASGVTQIRRSLSLLQDD